MVQFSVVLHSYQTHNWCDFLLDHFLYAEQNSKLWIILASVEMQCQRFCGVADAVWTARESFVCKTFHVQPGTLKWKSQETTKASTRHASRNLRNRCPCQKLRASDGGAGGSAAEVLASFQWSEGSFSLTPTTLDAVEQQISQILE